MVSGHPGDIINIFIIPQKLISANSATQKTATEAVAGGPEVTTAYLELRYDSVDAYRPIETEIVINKKHDFSDYIPRNNKLFCYPYNYLYLTNNAGSNNVYKYEDFYSNKCRFYLQLALSVGVSGRIEPIDYKNINENIDESVTIAKYPTCSWSTDGYTNWLTQQAVNISQRFLGNDVTFAIGRVGEVASGIIGSAGKLLGTAIGGTAGFITSALSGSIGDNLGQFSKQQLLPENESGSNAGDVNFADGHNAPRFFYMRCKTEYLRQIDDYFTRFGYKTLRVKVPNITGRENFNYIEIGSGERFAYGEIPPDALDEINSMAQSGLTIWHNHANIGNYSVSNYILP